MTDITSQELLVLMTRRSLDYQKSVADSVQTLTQDERASIREALIQDAYDPFAISTSYLYREQTIRKQNENKDAVREELDTLRHQATTFTPEDLLELKSENERKNQAIENVTGIYIIHNHTKEMYYIGQAIRVFDRAYRHFATNPASQANQARHDMTVQFDLPELHHDYHKGDAFGIHVIPLAKTTFSTLNELEAHAIVAYDSIIPRGYNRVSGHIVDKSLFETDRLEQAADLLIETISKTDIFWSLTNQEKRRKYTAVLFSELVLPRHTHFLLNFLRKIKSYQKANSIQKR